MSDEKTKTRSIEMSVTIEASPQDVWKAVAEAEGIKGWFAPEAKVTPGVGGQVYLSWGGGFSGGSRIDIWEPNRHLRTIEPVPEAPEKKEGYVARAPLTVDYLIEGKGGTTTTLRLVHSGFGAGADWDDEFTSTKRGWSVFLSNLKNYLERYRGRGCTQTMAMLPLTGPAAEVWPRLLGKNALVREGRLEGVAAGARYQVQTGQGDVLEGTVAAVEAPTALILDVDNLSARAYFTLEKGFLFAALLAYGDKASTLAGHWQSTIEGATRA